MPDSDDSDEEVDEEEEGTSAGMEVDVDEAGDLGDESVARVAAEPGDLQDDD
jgi:hypothetical protein